LLSQLFIETNVEFTEPQRFFASFVLVLPMKYLTTSQRIQFVKMFAAWLLERSSGCFFIIRYTVCDDIL